MKKIFLITLFLLLSFSSTSLAVKFAARDDSLRTGTKSAVRQNAINSNDTQKIDNLKKRADGEIDRRIAALNKLIDRLSQMKKISSTQLDTFKADIQTNIDGLNALKTKIDADTDLTTLRTDVKSIVTDYRIFAFYIQYVNLTAALDRATTTITNVTAVYDKLSTRITEAQTAGKDVASLKTTLASMKAKLDLAKTSADQASAEILPLTKVGFPENKSTLLDARSKLKSARENLFAAVKDAKTIIKSLRVLEKVNETISPTQTPSI